MELATYNSRGGCGSSAWILPADCTMPNTVAFEPASTQITSCAMIPGRNGRTGACRAGTPRQQRSVREEQKYRGTRQHRAVDRSRGRQESHVQMSTEKAKVDGRDGQVKGTPQPLSGSVDFKQPAQSSRPLEVPHESAHDPGVAALRPLDFRFRSARARALSPPTPSPFSTGSLAPYRRL